MRTYEPLIENEEIRYVNKSQVADYFGVNYMTVDNWVRRGCPYITKGGTKTNWVFDLRAVGNWRNANVRQVPIQNFGIKANGDNDNNDDGELEKSPKYRLEQCKAERERLRYEKELRDLIPAIEVETVCATVMKELAQSLDTLVDVIERKLALSIEDLSQLQIIVDEIREGMYTNLQALTESDSENGDE